MPAFNSRTNCMGSPGKIYDCPPNCHPVLWVRIRPQYPDLITERSFDSKVTWVTDVLGLFFNMLSMGVYTTRH